ncbi:hypothetical protein PHPALM_31025 [Phytophthora palmivora]|uniref:PiggyBac transposable element-derived protein domain-containing protein n=1 Tax=Phytophthora palmivora TaxID=4796 RepID=A0A2P4X3N5_9STRA|nr:hypothetical protein PHPALM_31025 [Phytophthora palmivora]
MKDKPHKWGAKLFMLNCSSTAYCIRFEPYLGKNSIIQGQEMLDAKTGPVAVARNLHHVFGDRTTQRMRLVVMDRYYTSVPLALHLLSRGFYSIGTVVTRRLGLSKYVIEKKKKRPINIERGTFTFAESTKVADLKMLHWWDNRPVHMLCTGGSIEMDRVVRREKTGEQAEVACPRVLKDYQTYMGGVDVHDQLRLQSCAVQEILQELFLGFVDLAVINAFIVFNIARTAHSKPKISHISFLKQLHLELCQFDEPDWDIVRRSQGLQGTPTKRRTPEGPVEHKPVLTEEMRKGNTEGSTKRRTRACKVCTILKEKINGGDTSSYCSGCVLQASGKSKSSRVYLCCKVKNIYDGKARSCFDIWHECWRNGALKPSGDGKRSTRVQLKNDGGDDDAVPQNHQGKSRRLQ